MALATAEITTLIDNMIAAINDADIEGIVGVYFGDQESYSAYPVIAVGAPPLMNENFPLIASGNITDEVYNIPILLYVKYEDTLANNKQFYNLTGAIRTALRNDYFSGYVMIAEIQQTRYMFAQRGNDLFRVSETTIQYRKRINRT